VSDPLPHTHETATSALDALALLRDGWADVDSVAPSAESIEAARPIARALVDAGAEFEIDGDVNGHSSIAVYGDNGRHAWFSVIHRECVVLAISGNESARTMRVDIGSLSPYIDLAIKWTKGTP
jgi:hypothetical protein